LYKYIEEERITQGLANYGSNKT